MKFEILGPIRGIEIITRGPGVRVRYEAHGIGKWDLKIKRYLDEV